MGTRRTQIRMLLGLWLALGSVIGCGGRSIGMPDDDGKHPEDGGRSEDTRVSCEEACEEAATCARAPYDCAFFCGEAESGAQEAGCRPAYAALVACMRTADDPCAAKVSCLAEVNAFGVCLLDYCDRHRSARICLG
jgi:hypothetical protein